MFKKEGFVGQRAIVLPQKVLERIQEDAVNQLLFITGIGYYPTALFHHRWRRAGAEQHTLIYCVSGKGWCKLNTSTYTIGPDQFVIIPKVTTHTHAADGNDPWLIYWVQFTGPMANVVANVLLWHHIGMFVYGEQVAQVVPAEERNPVLASNQFI